MPNSKAKTRKRVRIATNDRLKKEGRTAAQIKRKKAKADKKELVWKI